MSRLEDVQPHATVRGISPDDVVTVISLEWYGSDAVELNYKDSFGRAANQLLCRHDESRIKVVEAGRPWSFDGAGGLLRLVSEAHRIHLAHLLDPLLAVHTSMVEPLPHQLTAGYEAMLALIMDFARRQALANPHYRSPDNNGKLRQFHSLLRALMLCSKTAEITLAKPHSAQRMDRKKSPTLGVRPIVNRHAFSHVSPWRS